MTWLCLMHNRGEEPEMVSDRVVARVKEVEDTELGTVEPERRMVLYQCSKGCGNVIMVEEQDSD